MKALTSLKVLTLASLMVYSAIGFAQNKQQPGGAAIYVDPKADQQAKNPICLGQLQTDLSDAGEAQTNIDALSKIIDPSGNFTNNGVPDLSSTTSTNNPGADTFKVNAAKKAFYACLRGTTVTDTDDKKCTQAQDALKEPLKTLNKDCKNAPKVKISGSDGQDDLDSTETDGSTRWGACLKDADSCMTAIRGDNDSADKCVGQTLEELQRAGGSPKELKDYCQSQYPKQCGPNADASHLKDLATDLSSDLNSTKKDLDAQLKDKQDELKKDQDQLMADRKKQQTFATDFMAQDKKLQDNYEASVKAANAQIDSTLEANFKKIAADQQLVKNAADDQTRAQAVQFDAAGKLILQCKAKARKDADAQYPPNAVLSGNVTAATTRNSRWSAYYNQRYTYYCSGDGLDGDGGNYANASLAMLNSERAYVLAKAQVVKDQTDLQFAMTKNNYDKTSAAGKAMQNQQLAVVQLKQSQNKEVTDTINDVNDLSTKTQQAQADIIKLNAQISAVPAKQQCIQTLRSCASQSGGGVTNSHSDAPDVNSGMDDANNLISACTDAGKACASSSVDTNTLFTGGTDLPKKYYNSPDCLAVLKDVNWVKGTALKDKSADGTASKSPKPQPPGPAADAPAPTTDTPKATSNRQKGKKRSGIQ